jgi:hypothetical protein
MTSPLPAAPCRAYRRDGKLVLEIDEHCFCQDAFLQSASRIVDRDAFLAFTCEHLFTVMHDDDDSCHPTWWLRFAQAVGDEAADAGAGVRLHDGEDRLPICQPPDLFPDEVTRALLGQHSKETVLFATERALLEISPPRPGPAPGLRRSHPPG